MKVQEVEVRGKMLYGYSIYSAESKSVVPQRLRVFGEMEFLLRLSLEKALEFEVGDLQNKNRDRSNDLSLFSIFTILGS